MAGQLPEGEAAEGRAGVAAGVGEGQTGRRPRGLTSSLISTRTKMHVNGSEYVCSGSEPEAPDEGRHAGEPHLPQESAA